MRIRYLFTFLSLFSLALGSLSAGVAYVEPAKPYRSSAFLKSVQPGKVDISRGVVNVPLITWAADGVTVDSNGGLAPKSGSALADAMGVTANLELVDNFDKQVANYLSGHSPFLRGTAGMINLASETLASYGPDYAPVVIVQLSWSTGADGFVAKDINTLADLRGKTIVVQKSGPHVDLVQVLLEDAGLKPGDVTIKFVNEITYNESVAAQSDDAHDPASAFREDSSISGAACIFPDILTLTAGGQVGTGAEDSVHGARPVLSTRTASRVIADVYAVRSDFLRDHRAVVHGFVKSQLAGQAAFQVELDNIAKKSSADKGKLAAFKKRCEPLAGLFLMDEAAVNDYIAWVGVDLELPGQDGNFSFFANQNNPVGFRATSDRILKFYQQMGFVSGLAVPAVADWNFATDFGPGAKVSKTKSVQTFSNAADVRKAAESEDASLLFSSAFQFPANTSDIQWRNHRDIFATLHEKVSRYGGAVVQLRGHSDNFFYNFVAAKKQQGATTYKKRIKGTNDFRELPLPKVEQVVNSANQLSYERAFAVKRAYAQYLRESLGYTNDEIDLSRFDVKGMGVSAPVHAKPADATQRAENMRGEMFIYAVEAEIDLDFGVGDLQ